MGAETVTGDMFTLDCKGEIVVADEIWSAELELVHRKHPINDVSVLRTKKDEGKGTSVANNKNSV